MIKVFCDGIFDLFHHGHVDHFKKIKNAPNIHLIVGIISDKNASEYKRVPIFNEVERIKLISSCKYVDEIIVDSPLIITEDFIIKHSIDFVAHAFQNDDDYEKQNVFYDVPIKMNKMLIIKYNHGIDSTSLIECIFGETKTSSDEYFNDWHKIWHKKGTVDTSDLVLLDGYEETDFDSLGTTKNITSVMNILPHDKILEIGCGAGNLSQHFNEYDYIGIDYSRPLVNKNIKLTKSTIYHCEAKNTPFKDNYFDKTFACSVFEYFPNKEYAIKVIHEMIRVTKPGGMIYIMNLRKVTHAERKNKHVYDGCFTHQVYTPDDFDGFDITDPTYDKINRFSIIKTV
jgi:cytidyltransferase-like protein